MLARNRVLVRGRGTRRACRPRSVTPGRARVRRHRPGRRRRRRHRPRSRPSSRRPASLWSGLRRRRTEPGRLDRRARAAALRDFGLDGTVVVPVGGGSSMDSAKAISICWPSTAGRLGLDYTARTSSRAPAHRRPDDRRHRFRDHTFGVITDQDGGAKTDIRSPSVLADPGMKCLTRPPTGGCITATAATGVDRYHSLDLTLHAARTRSPRRFRADPLRHLYSPEPRLPTKRSTERVSVFLGVRSGQMPSASRLADALGQPSGAVRRRHGSTAATEGPAGGRSARNRAAPREHRSRRCSRFYAEAAAEDRREPGPPGSSSRIGVGLAATLPSTSSARHPRGRGDRCVTARFPHAPDARSIQRVRGRLTTRSRFDAARKARAYHRLTEAMASLLTRSTTVPWPPRLAAPGSRRACEAVPATRS